MAGITFYRCNMGSFKGYFVARRCMSVVRQYAYLFGLAMDRQPQSPPCRTPHRITIERTLSVELALLDYCRLNTFCRHLCGWFLIHCWLIPNCFASQLNNPFKFFYFLKEEMKYSYFINNPFKLLGYFVSSCYSHQIIIIYVSLRVMKMYSNDL